MSKAKNNIINSHPGIDNELPKGWKSKPIEKIFKIKSGEFLSAKMMVEDGNYNVYGGNGVNGRHNTFNIAGENIIIGRVGANCGNVHLVNEKLWLTHNAFYISEYYEDVSKPYLAKLLYFQHLRESANEAAQPVISYNGIKDILLPLPPLPEQQRIVKKLDALFEHIDKAIQLTRENGEHSKHLATRGAE